MKSSEILNLAAEYIETGRKIYGCDALRTAANNGVWGLENPEYLKAFKYFEKYKPAVQYDDGFAWWPMGNHPERIKALRNAAKDALENGD